MPPNVVTPDAVAKIKTEPGEEGAIRAGMADKATRARQSMAFRYWIQNKASPEERDQWDNSSLDTKGKQQLLLRWLVWRGRNFTSEIEQQTVVAMTTSRSSGTSFTWMSREQLETQKGVNKAKLMIQSGKLESRPCRVTGSTEPDAIEFKAFGEKSECLRPRQVQHGL